MITFSESVFREIQILWGSSFFFSKYLKFIVHFKNDNQQSQDLACQKQRLFSTQLTWKWPMNMTKMLWGRFEQCLGTFTMLLVEGSSERGLFRHLSNHVFGVRHFRNAKSMRIIFWWEIFKISCRLQQCTKKFTKSFLFPR